MGLNKERKKPPSSMAIISWYLLPTFLALYAITRHFLHKILNFPPSPFFCFPIIGHLYLLKKPLHRSLSKLSTQYGPILLLQFGYRRILVVSSPSAAEECLTKNDILFANRPGLAAGQYLGNNYTSLAWAPYGDHWRNLRRISSIEILSAHRIQTLYSIRKDEIKLLIKQLMEINRDRTVEVKTALYELTLNVMMRMIAGKRYYGDNVKDSEEARRFQKIMADTARVGRETYLGDFLFVMKIFKFGTKRMIELQRTRNEFMQGLIEERRRTRLLESSDKLGGKRSKTLIEVLLSLQDTEPEYYKDEIISSFVLVLLLGGTDTTATTMEWALCLLINHPEIFKKAQGEIDNLVGHDRLIEETDLAQLPYLRSVINETTRLYPAVPMLLPHESSEECTVGSFRVPRGTMLLVNVWAIQNDSNVWTETTKFKPERFAGIDGNNVAIRDGFKLMPFGSGRRGCPGEALATRMVGLTLGSLIQCFNWESHDAKMVDMTDQVGFSLSKAEPLHAKCSPRPVMLRLLSQL